MDSNLPSIPIQYPGRFNLKYETGKMSGNKDLLTAQDKDGREIFNIHINQIQKVDFVNDKSIMIVQTGNKKYKIRIGMDAFASMSESGIASPANKSAHSVAAAFTDEWVKPWLAFFESRHIPVKSRTSATSWLNDIASIARWFD